MRTRPCNAPKALTDLQAYILIGDTRKDGGLQRLYLSGTPQLGPIRIQNRWR